MEGPTARRGSNPCLSSARRPRGSNAARLAALGDRVDADLAAGHHREVIAELESIVAEHPFEERFWGQLMLALYRSGSQADALALLLAAATLAQR